MTSVFVQSDTPNQWLPAQDWQVGLLTGTAFVGSGKNKSNQYLAIPHETQALFGDALPQLSSNVVTNLSESLDKAIKLLGEISSRFSDPRPVTGNNTVRFKPVPGTVFGSGSTSATSLSIADTTLALPAAPPVPTTVPAQDGGCSAAASVALSVSTTVPAQDSTPPSAPADGAVSAPPVPTTAPSSALPAQDGGCSAAASVPAQDSAPSASSHQPACCSVSTGAAPLSSDSQPATVTTVPLPAVQTQSALVPVTQPSVPVDLSALVPTAAQLPALPSVTAQGITVNVPLPAVTPAVPTVTVPPAQSSLLSKFFASAPVAPPAPPTMGSIKPLVQPFLEASNNIRAANIASFEPRFGEVLTRLAQVLFQTRQVLQSDDDFRLWKQLADTFFRLKQTVSDRKRSGVLCNLRTGTSRLYIITSLSQEEVNKRYTHSKPFMLEPASLNLLKKFA